MLENMDITFLSYLSFAQSLFGPSLHPGEYFLSLISLHDTYRVHLSSCQIPRICNTYSLANIATIDDILFGFDISSVNATIGIYQYTEVFDNPHGIVPGDIGSTPAACSAGGWEAFRERHLENVKYV